MPAEQLEGYIGAIPIHSNPELPTDMIQVFQGGFIYSFTYDEEGHIIDTHIAKEAPNGRTD